MSVLRISRLAVAALLSIGLSFVIAPSAMAANYGGGTTVSTSGSSVTAGQPFVVTVGSGFTPGETVTGVLGNVIVRGTANAQGGVSISFPTTGLSAGNFTATLTGASSGVVASASVSILPAAGAVSGSNASGIPANASGSSSTGSNTGGLAFTGAAGVVPLALGGVVLVAAGAGAVVVTRKRKTVA
jgi:hypothetical protein